MDFDIIRDMANKTSPLHILYDIEGSIVAMSFSLNQGYAIIKGPIRYYMSSKGTIKNVKTNRIIDDYKEIVIY